MEQEYHRDHHKNSSKLVFALAREIQQYLEANAEQFDSNVWDNVQHWRSGILSQGVITQENLAEIMEYLGAEKLQELIDLASSKT